MTRLNNFGAVNTDVISLYPGSVALDYGGTSAVDAALGRAARVFAMALSPDVWRQMRLVEAQCITRFATAGQTTATLGITPIISGTVHLWQYPNSELFDPNNYRSFLSAGGGWPTDWYYRKPRMGVLELSGYAVTASTGAITGLTNINTGDVLYASYEVDTDNASFSLPSIADACLYGAASELGAFLYTEGTAEWKLVDEYRQRWKDVLARAQAGTWVPDELRKLTYWQSVDRGSEEVSSVRLYRG